MRQEARRNRIDQLFEEPWVTLYAYRDEDTQEAWFSALLAPDRVPAALRTLSWDTHPDEDRPCLVRYGQDAAPRYERFQRDGVEPLVLARERDAGPLALELTEECRLFLNLFPDGDGNLYRVLSSGDREVVVKVTENTMIMLRRPLTRYLQARQMTLAVYFDHQVWFDGVTENPLPEDEQEVEVVREDRRWGFGALATGDQLLTRLSGKRLLAPPPHPTSADKDDDDRCMDFIIGYDATGRPREHTANPRALSNMFGSNPGAPNYLTRVHFRREVLDRYFHNPGRFTVSDGSVRHGSHWVLSIDDDHADRVIAFLGDLGRDLPYTEQLHWRMHNVAPDGPLSQTAFARSFEARFADGTQLEHRFKAAYEQLAMAWTAKEGWPLFRPLASADQYLLTKLHVPTSDNPAELDAQILGLAKILVDALNDPALDAALGTPIEGERSLGKLERFLTGRGYGETERDLAVLRAIQGLRSSGVAHTRGSTYAKSLQRLGLDGQPAPVIVASLLEGAVRMLETLIESAAKSA